MLKAELTYYGLDDTLKEIMADLEGAVGKEHSKKRKDEILYKTLGAINAIFNMMRVSEAEPKSDEKEE